MAHARNFIDLTGQRFGRLTVIEESEPHIYSNGKKRAVWKCICDCGNISHVESTSLRTGHTSSCGCISKEMLKNRNKENRTHGMSGTRIYNLWYAMQQRCYRKSHKHYNDYGGRGITVCDEWLGEHGPENFAKWAYANGYDENAERGECTLDRKDNNKGYYPDNCRWITDTEQKNNTRKNVFLTYKGETKTVAEWAKCKDLNRSIIYQRMKRGWSTEKILETPPRKNK